MQIVHVDNVCLIPYFYFVCAKCGLFGYLNFMGNMFDTLSMDPYISWELITLDPPGRLLRVNKEKIQ